FYSIDLVGNVVEARFAGEALHRAASAGKIATADVAALQQGVEQEGIQGKMKKVAQEKFPKTQLEQMEKEDAKGRTELVETLLADSHSGQEGVREGAAQWLTLQAVGREISGSVSFWK